MAGIITAGVIAGAGAVYGAKKAGDAAKDAARIQGEAADQSVQFQREALESLRQDLAPYSNLGQAAAMQLAGNLGLGQQYQAITQQNALARYNGGQDLGGRVLSDSAAQSMLGRDSSRQDELIAEIERSQSGVRRLETEKQQALAAGDQGTASRIQSYIDDHNRNQERWTSELQSQPLTQSTLQYYLRSGQEDLIPEGTFASQAQGAGTVGKGGQFTPAPQLGQGLNVGAPAGTQQGPQRNAMLQGALSEIQGYNPMDNPLLARAAQERMDFDPLSNPLLAQAMEEQAAYDPSNVLNENLLQNPLLQALQKDVTRRLTANQAARGKLGSGQTAEALQERLVPQAINFGLQLDQLQRQAIADRARLGGMAVGLQDAAISGREATGTNLVGLERQAIADRLQGGTLLEDLQQRDITNLQNLIQLGQSSAARTGAAGMTTAGNIGQTLQSNAAVQGNAALQRAQAQNQLVGGITGAGLSLLGSFAPGFQPQTSPEVGMLNYTNTGQRYT